MHISVACAKATVAAAISIRNALTSNRFGKGAARRLTLALRMGNVSGRRTKVNFGYL